MEAIWKPCEGSGKGYYVCCGDNFFLYNSYRICLY